MSERSTVAGMVEAHRLNKERLRGIDEGRNDERKRWLRELEELAPSDRMEIAMDGPTEWEGYKTGWYAALEELRRRMMKEEPIISDREVDACVDVFNRQQAEDDSNELDRQLRCGGIDTSSDAYKRDKARREKEER